MYSVYMKLKLETRDIYNDDLHTKKERKLRYLDQCIVLFIIITLVAVAAVKVLQHGGDGEGQEKQPYDDRDLRRFLDGFEEILPPGMHHVEIPIYGGDGQEGDAGPSVQKQHEEHRLAHHVVGAPSLSLDVVVSFDRQTEEQEDVCQHQVEQEDIVGVGFPELEFEYEEMENGCIERKSQDKNHNHDSGVKIIQRLVCGFTFFYELVAVVPHFNVQIHFF